MLLNVFVSSMLQAEEDNPDPSQLAPAEVIGWESLKERLVGQQQEMQKMANFVAVRIVRDCVCMVSIGPNRCDAEIRICHGA